MDIPIRYRFVALGSRLKGVDEVLTLGVRPNFQDYSEWERRLILSSPIILYPTCHYAQYFFTMGKPIFPSLDNYLYAGDKIKQTTLFSMLNIPHPRTRFYFPRHFHQILRDFDFPFVAKIPRASAGGRGVFLIQGKGDLDVYLSKTKVAYIQEYIEHKMDLRVILVNYDPVLAYWRIQRHNEFRTNVYMGAEINFDGVPKEAIEFAIKVAKKCRFNDIGLDVVAHNGTWLVLEANSHYGRVALEKRGMDLKTIIMAKLNNGPIGSII